MLTGICRRCGKAQGLPDGCRCPTKADVERAVEGLFTGNHGQKATTLALFDSRDDMLNAGLLYPADVVEHLCKALGVEQ